MSSYNETDPVPKDLDLTTPTEGATPPAEVNNAIREAKRVLKIGSAIITTTGNLQLTEQHSTVLINGAHTITLPTIADVSSSTFTKRYRIINISASTGVLKTKASGETLNGSNYASTGLNLAVQYAEYLVYGNGTVWYMERAADINGGTVKAITSLTAANDLDIGAHELKAETFESDVATGTAPLVVASTTEVTNLNAAQSGKVTDQGGGANLLCMVIDIGDWDMNASASVNVAHGISDYTKIRSVAGMIRPDSGGAAISYPLTPARGFTVDPDANIQTTDGTNIVLARLTGGIFDGASFNETSYNRGWLMVWYTE